MSEGKFPCNWLFLTYSFVVEIKTVWWGTVSRRGSGFEILKGPSDRRKSDNGGICWKC
jgi:hypothetical protein